MSAGNGKVALVTGAGSGIGAFGSTEPKVTATSLPRSAYIWLGVG